MKVDFSRMEDLEIQEILTKCNDELKRRKNYKKDKLVEAFQIAYENLRKEGIYIYYSGVEEEVEINRFEFFSFL